MTPPEERAGDWAGIDGATWGEIDGASPGDPIHAFVDFVVLLVILASAVACLTSAFGIW